MITYATVFWMGVESEPYEAVNGVVGLFFITYGAVIFIS